MATSGPSLNVSEFLEQQAKHFKSTEVDKVIDIDLGHLLASDINPIDIQSLRGNREEALRSLARDNTQLLINDIFKLPTDRVADVVVAKLPAPLTILPREKPLPKPKPPTKWEQYAKSKGIVKTKRSRMVWDDVQQEYRPRWGYKRKDDEKDVWCLPVPDNADPYEDQFEKRAEAKKERVAKNEYQRMKNIARAQKGGVKAVRKVMEATKLPPTKPNKHELTQAMDLAKKSTASGGVFTNKIRDEPLPKKTGKKRKFDAVVGDFKSERSKHLEFAAKYGSDKPMVDMTKAVNKHIDTEDRSRARGEPPAKRRSKAGGGKGKGGAKKGGGSFKSKGSKPGRAGAKKGGKR